MIMEPVNIFMSYSHADEALMKELVEFLQPLVNSKKIELWSDEGILVGDVWDDSIKNALHEADMILFLLSPSFLASTYVNGVEIAEAFRRWDQGRGELTLVPVMLRPCGVNDHVIPGETYQIKDIQGLPTGMKPVSRWGDRGEAWMNIAEGLKRVFKNIQDKKNQA